MTREAIVDGLRCATLGACFGLDRPAMAGVATEPVEHLLQGVRADQLFDIDERVRRYNGAGFRAWPDKALTAIAASTMTPSIRQSLLFLVEA